MIDAIPPEALLAGFEPSIRSLAERLRVIVRRAEPAVIERVRPGWRIIGYDVPLGGRRRSYFAWIMVETLHVHLGFRYGVLMDDPDGLLDGDAKLGRWTTLRPGDPLDAAAFGRLVTEGARIGRLTAAERAGRLLERKLLVLRPLP